MEPISVCIRCSELESKIIPFTPSDGEICFFLPPVYEKTFTLEMHFGGSTGVMNIRIKGEYGPECICYPENGFAAGRAAFSPENKIRFCVICPENADLLHLKCTFSSVTINNGNAFMEAIQEKLLDLEERNEIQQEKIDVLTEKLKRTSSGDAFYQQKTIWDEYMSSLLAIISTRKWKNLCRIEKAVNKIRTLISHSGNTTE